MILSIQCDVLRQALSRVMGAVARRNTIQILDNVLLTAADGRLSLRATNLDMEIAESVEADVSAPGVTTVPARLLSDFLKSLLSGATINMSLKDRLTVTAGRARANLSTLPAGDFPTFSLKASEPQITIPAKVLAGLLGKVSFAQASDSRFHLCGVYLHRHAGRLRLVATDGAALAKVDGPEIASDFPSVILPSQTVAAIARLLGEGGGDAELSIDPQGVVLSVSGTRLASKIIDGNFPDYARVIPNPGRSALISIAALTRAIATAESAEAPTRGIRLDLSANALTVSRRGEGGEASDDLEVDYDGPDASWSMNARYALEALGTVDGDDVELRLDAPQDPMIWRSPGDDACLVVTLALRT